MAHRCGDGPAAGHQQHIATVLGLHMRQGGRDAVDKVGVRRHALGLGLAAHPGLQALAQQTKVVFVKLRGVGLGQGLGVDGVNHRMAVVFVQARPHQVLQLGLAHAFGNAPPSLPLTLQTAGDDGFKSQSALLKISAQAATLALAEFGQLVIVVGAKRGLAVAHQVKSSHGLIVANRCSLCRLAGDAGRIKPGDQSVTWPLMQTTDSPPTHTWPCASHCTCTRPARPKAVPWRAT